LQFFLITEPIKSTTRCQQLATVATLIVWALAQSRGDRHRSLMTPERVLSEYNEDLIFLIFEELGQHLGLD